jgi:hypothetical protein
LRFQRNLSDSDAEFWPLIERDSPLEGVAR